MKTFLLTSFRIAILMVWLSLVAMFIVLGIASSIEYSITYGVLLISTGILAFILSIILLVAHVDNIIFMD
jgi:hypothetical protein